MSRPEQWVQPIFVASQHCLASFWRQTNIKISWDLGKMVTKNRSAFYNESGSAFYNESGIRVRSVFYNVPRWGRDEAEMKPGWESDETGITVCEVTRCYIKIYCITPVFYYLFLFQVDKRKRMNRHNTNRIRLLSDCELSDSVQTNKHQLDRWPQARQVPGHLQTD